MTRVPDDIVEKARAAVAHDPEVNISLMGVRTIIEVADALRHQSSEGATHLDDVRAAMRDMGWREIVIDYLTSPNPQTSGGE